MSEQRLIDANALGKILSQRYKEIEAKNGLYDHYACGFDDAISYVGEAPAIEAVPVVHARWREPWPYHTGVICGKCETHAARKHHYCPNCGAKMDGGATDV